MATPFGFLLVGKVPLTLFRRGLPTEVRGRFVDPEPIEVIIKANVQPVVKSTDVRMLPEGDRSKAVLMVFSNAEIRMQKEGPNGWLPDTFFWEGDEYEIMKSVSYKMGVLDHYEAVAARKERT